MKRTIIETWRDSLSRLTNFTGLAVVCAIIIGALPAHGQFAKPSLLVSGTIADAETGQPLKARISFMNPSGAEENKVRTDSKGKYQAVLKPGKSYTLHVVSAQYYTAVETLDPPGDNTYHQLSKDVRLSPIKNGTVLFNAGCFAQGNVTIEGDASSKIAAIGSKMAHNDEIVVTVETFSDSNTASTPPPDEGTQRANAIKAALVANGAQTKRIILKPHDPIVTSAPSNGNSKKKKKKAPAPLKTKHGKKIAVPPQLVTATITISNVLSGDDE